MSKTKAEELYADIINLPHHELTTRQRMPIINRAASFSSFAALTGYDEHIREAGRITDEKIELDDERKEKISKKLNYTMEFAEEDTEITITYFLSDNKKFGGAYVNHTGIIKRIDEYERKIIFTDKTVIAIDDIYEIDSELFNGLE